MSALGSRTQRWFRPRWSRRPLGGVLICLLLGLLSSTTAATALTVEQIESSKGIKAWLVEEHSIPLVAIRFAFAGGTVQDPPGKEGLASLVSDLIMEGAGDLSGADFKERLSLLGALLTTSSRRDAMYGGLDTLTARSKPSGELLRLMLMSPHFSAADVNRLKAQRLTDLAVAANNPTRIVLERWYAEAFPDHPYGRPIQGTPESVARLTSEDCKGAHARLFAKDALKVVIVGDIDRRAAVEMLDAVFGDLPDKARLTPVGKAEPRSAQMPIVVERDFPLATAAFGLPALPVDHLDYPALKVLNHIIGSGDFDSRLMDEIRVKRGLAYSIQTSLEHDSLTSFMLGTFATKNETMQPALSVLKDVLVRTARDGPTTPEFENARQYLTGSFLLDFDASGKIASSLLRIWLDGEGPDAIVARGRRINNVTLGDVKRVARQALETGELLVTVVGRPTVP
jgi:zinc protease